MPIGNQFITFLLTIAGVLAFATADAQTISGTVFRDYNADGTRQTAEPGVAGIEVRAYNAAGTNVTPGSAVTTASGGTYTLTPTTGAGTYRLEFTIPASLTYLEEGFRSTTGAGTSVQFVATGATGVNFGVSGRMDYCQAVPPVATPCYVSGNPLATGSTVASEHVLVSVPYTASGTAVTPTSLADANEIGSVWGLAYQRETSKLFSAAFLKRHVGLGSAGLGGIYVTTTNGTPTNAVYVDLENAPFSLNLGQSLLGTRTTLPSSGTASSTDPTAFSLVGAAGLGDMALSSNGATLYIVDLFNRQLLALNIGNPAKSSFVAGDLTRITVPTPATCTNGVARPFAVTVRDGKVYIGVVCTGENTGGTVANLYAYVYAMDEGATTIPTTPIMSFRLNYDKGSVHTGDAALGGEWQTWATQFSQISIGAASGAGTRVARPQPMLSSISFTDNGDMVLGLMDRGGHQLGFKQPGTSGTTTYNGYIGGDILRANYNGTAWVLERNGTVGSVTSLSGVGNNQGPGTPTSTTYTAPGGEFYYADNYSGTNGQTTVSEIHQETFMGSAINLPGFGHTVGVVMDPTDVWTGGIRWFNDATGGSVREVELYQSTGGNNLNPNTQGKANGLGDVEALCAPAPIEIGNRVWLDSDNDGVQEPGEPGLAGVRVTLTGPGIITGSVSVTTNAQGEYYFTTATGTAATGYAYGLPLTSGSSYTLSFPTSYGTNGLSSKANSATGTNADRIDTDPNTAGIVAFTLGGSGENDFSYDAGYAPIALAVTATPSACNTATNGYTVAGTVSFTNVTAGTLTVTDGTSTTTIAVAAGTTSTAYSLTGLNSGTGSHTVTASFSNTVATPASVTYTAPASCTVGVAVTATPAACNTATNGYTVTGTISLTNAPAGTATVTDGSATTTVTVSAGATSVAYSLSGLTSGTGSHTVTVTFAGKTASAVYSAPASCTLGITVTATPGTCNTATNGYTVTGTISLTNAPAGTATITDGSSSTTVAISAGATSVAYSLSGLNSGTGSHTVVVTFFTKTASATYTAPTSCTCPVINTPSAAQAVCSGTTVNSLTVATSATGAGAIRFVYFTSPQSGTAMYSGGTSLATATPASGTASISNLPFPDNTGPTATTYYVYAILNPAPSSQACRPSAEIAVTVLPRPVGTATTSGIVSCVDAATLTGTSTIAGSTYSWTGPNGFSSTAQSFTTNVAGTYRLTVTAPNGCGDPSPSTTSVSSDTAVPQEVTASNAGPLTCAQPTVAVSATSTTTGVSYRWVGPNSFVSTAQSFTTGVAGSYSVTVTAPNGCTTVTTTAVTSNTAAPTVTASNTGPLTCTNTTVTVSASGSTGVTHRWTGPNGFVSTAQSFTTATAGTYSVTVTAANGCTAATTTTVASNTAAPTVTASNTGPLTCTNTSVNVSAAGSAGVSYRWVGPNNFGSTAQSFATSVAGTYSVTVTAPNGCTAIATTTVTSNTLTPSVSVNSLTLTCAQPSGLLTATPTNATSPIYRWSTGATTASITVLAAGPYSVTVSSANGCTATTTTTVQSNTLVPVVSATNTGPLTCTNTSVTVSASTTTAGATYRWSSGQTTPSFSTTTAAGTYSVTVTAPNGCTATAETTLAQDVTPPQNVTATNTGPITCTNTVVTVSASSTSSGVSYYWVGPGGLTPVTPTPDPPVRPVEPVGPTQPVQPGEVAQVEGSSQTAAVSAVEPTNGAFTTTAQSFTTSTPGTYTVTVTGANGCTVTTTTTVIEDKQAPEVTATNTGPITCTNTVVTVSASTTTTGATYRWSSGQTTPNFTTSTAATYSVTVTAPNGCTATAETTLAQDVTPPQNVTVTNTGPMTCTLTTVTVSASSTTPGVTYRWSGPSSFTSTAQSFITSVAGTYSVTVTAPNGCTAATTTVVFSSTAAPAGTSASNDGPLTCTKPTATVSATSTTADVTYRWSGPSSFTSTAQSFTTSTSGTYSVTITGPNGCTIVRTTAVANNRTTPAGTSATNDGALTCAKLTSTVSATSTTAGVSYRWSGPSSFISTAQSFTTSTTGTYSVTITGTNGCTIVRTTTVSSNTAAPAGVSTTSDGPLTCAKLTATVSATSTTTGVIYRWSGPDSFTSTAQSFTTSTPGTYSVIVTGANGCTATATTTVAQDVTPPQDVTATNTGPLTCTNTSVTVSASTTTAGATYRWSSGQTTPSFSTTTAATYSVTVTAPNGCTATAETTVAQDVTLPQNVTATNTGPITCTNTVVTVSASSTSSGVSYYWVGPGGLTPVTPTPDPPVRPVEPDGPTQPVQSQNSLPPIGTDEEGVFSTRTQSFTTSTPGTYTVTVTGANGCSTTATTTVIQDVTTPVVSATNTGPITCTNTSVTLIANTTTAGATYRWSSGQTTASFPTTTAGTYSVTVTAPNGCTATATTIVTQNITPPTVSASASGTLTCAVTAVTVSATASPAGSSFVWNGPNGFTSTAQSFTTTTPGSYSVTVTAPNGCSATTAVTVQQNIAPPTVSASGGVISCQATSIQLTASSTAPNVTYSWTGSNGFASSQQNPTASAVGTYTVTVTNSVNGCTASDTALVAKQPCASLGNYVFEDVNANGIQDAGEPAIENVTVSLYQNTTLVASTTTNASGIYSFTGLAPGGAYQVQFSTPTGYTATVANAGSNDALDSDANPTTGRTGDYTLAEGENNVTVDAGFYRPAALGDRVFVDANRNGVQDAGEAGISGVAVQLYTGTNTLVASTTTNTSGVYSFAGLTPGVAYSVGFTRPTNYSASVADVTANGGTDLTDSDASPATGRTGSYTLASGESNASVDAGFYPLRYDLALRKTVLNQPNPLLPGSNVTFRIEIINQGELPAYAGTLTDYIPAGLVFNQAANPGWSAGPNPSLPLTGTLSPGSSVSVNLVLQVASFAGGQSLTNVAEITTDDGDDVDSTPDAIAGNDGTATDDAVLNENGDQDDSDFAVITPLQFASLGNYVFEDVNVNGIQDTGEPALEGIPVSLYQNATLVASTTTNASGIYSFTGLAPGGAYQVQFSAPTGYTATVADAGGNDALDSDANPATGRTGNYTLAPGETNNSIDAGFYRPAVLGNRVFADTDQDGLQSAGEPGIAGVTVNLVNNGTVLATTTTDANGEYYFRNGNVTGGLLPNTAYEIQVPLSQTVLNGYTITNPNAGTNDEVDSDATLANGNAVISLTTGNNGGNDYTHDFGFVVCPTITNPSGSQTICAGTRVSSLTVATSATGAGAIRFVYFTSPQSGTAMYSGGTSLATATPASGTASISNLPFPDNTGPTATTYYVYAILNPTPTIASCRPSAEMAVTVLPRPVGTATTSGIVSCVDAATLTGTSTIAGSTYSWTGPNGFSSTAQSFTTNVAGTYRLTVTAPNGCGDPSPSTTSVSSDTAVPQEVTASNAGPLTCAQPTVAVSATSTTTGVSYRWVGPNSFVSTAQSFTTGVAGTYSVTVTAPNGCTAVASTTVTQPPALSVSTTQTEPVCNGGNTGRATVTATGGTPAYQYAWSNGATTPTASGLTAGVYSVTVTDANTCILVTSVTLTQPTALSLSATVTNAACNGAATGRVDLTVAGGTPGYQYVWSNGAITQDITSVRAGTYTVTVTDQNNCVSSLTAIVTEPPTLTLTLTGQDVACNGGINGAVNLTVAGGTAPYSYSWTNGTGQPVATTEDLSNLPAGTYDVRVTDANGCTSTGREVISQPTALTLSTTQQNVSCNGNAEGSIDLTVAGGTPGYTYRWSNGSGQPVATTQDVTGSVAGTYSVTITDANGCTATASVTINQPTALSLSVTAQNPNCNQGNDGSINLAVSGGVAPYTFAWSDNVTTEDRTGLRAGTYSVTVTDANGCTVTTSVTLTEPVVLTIVGIAQPVTCYGGSNGAVSLTVTGGTAPYRYSWSNGATTPSLVNLTAGNYTVTVTDARGCQRAFTAAVSQPEELVIEATPIQIQCPGETVDVVTISVRGGVTPYQYQWSGPDNFTANTASIYDVSAGSYTLVVTDANRCQATEVITITQPPPFNISTQVTPVTCFGGTNGAIDVSVTGGTQPYAYGWSNGTTAQDLTNVASGVYSLTVTDGAGCTTSLSATISQPTELSLGETHTNVTCFDGQNGTINLTVSGATAPYTYAWNDNVTSEDRTGLRAGTYTVTVTDRNGCQKTLSVSITQPAAFTLNAQTRDVACYGGTDGAISLTATGGTGTLTYRWSTGATTAGISNLTAGIYSVTVTDANACSTQGSYRVDQPDALQVTFTKQDIGCNGAATGSINVNVTGGTTPYQYAWSNGVTTDDRTGLVAGVYALTVTDANGCTQSVSVTISQPPALALATTQQNATCFGDNNGSVNVTTTGGTGAVTYQWNDGVTTEDRTGLTAGVYSLTVTDANGCTATASVTITQPAPVTVSASNNGPITYNQPQALVSASASPAGVSYQWSNGATTASFSTTVAGTYSVTVTGVNGCTATASTTVLEDKACPTVTTSNDGPITCAKPTASVSATSSVTGVSYQWSNGETTATFSTRLAGTYSVTVTAPNGCTVTASTTVSQTLVAATLTQGPCNANNTNATAADDYFLITVQATSGSSNAPNRYEVVLNANADGTGGTVLNPGGTPFDQSVTVGSPTTFRADGTTTYTLTIRDINSSGCRTTLTTTPVAPCSSCEAVQCPKVTIRKL